MYIVNRYNGSNEKWYNEQLEDTIKLNRDVSRGVRWAIETTTTRDNYDALNQSSVLKPLHPPFERSTCKFS